MKWQAVKMKSSFTTFPYGKWVFCNWLCLFFSFHDILTFHIPIFSLALSRLYSISNTTVTTIHLMMVQSYNSIRNGVLQPVKLFSQLQNIDTFCHGHTIVIWLFGNWLAVMNWYNVLWSHITICDFWGAVFNIFCPWRKWIS